MSEKIMHCVSSGSYSDYRVLCVCPSKADAERVLGKLQSAKNGYHSDAFIETLPVVTGDVEQVEILFLQQEIFDNGTQGQQRENKITTFAFTGYEDVSPCSWRWIRAPCHNNKGGRLELRGTDHARVRKVFSEKRAAIIAAPDVWREIREKSGRR